MNVQVTMERSSSLEAVTNCAWVRPGNTYAGTVAGGATLTVPMLPDIEQVCVIYNQTLIALPVEFFDPDGVSLLKMSMQPGHACIPVPIPASSMEVLNPDSSGAFVYIYVS